MESFDFLEERAGSYVQRHDAGLDAGRRDVSGIVFVKLIENCLSQRAALDVRLRALDLALNFFEDVAEGAFVFDGHFTFTRKTRQNG